MKRVTLKRNLRRSLLRGHPWVYREALDLPLPKSKKEGSQKDLSQSEMVKVLDHQKRFIGWALYDPHGSLSLRMLSLENQPPSDQYFQKQVQRCAELRDSLTKAPHTNAFRLINGEGDLLPGLVCDLYNDTAVVQFDGLGPQQFWEKYNFQKWISEAFNVKAVVVKPRLNNQKHSNHKDRQPTPDTLIQILENSALFEVNITKGQKTGFFLDQRDNRFYVKNLSLQKEALNLFSYTGGFSVFMGLGGARKVTSVDISQSSIDQANKNWKYNKLTPSHHEGLCTDAYDFILNTQKSWDLIVVDPPSMTQSEKTKPSAIKKYTHLFSSAAAKVRPGGHLCLSSCSSHINFDDFFQIITDSLSQCHRRGQIMRVSGQGPDHPFPHICHHFRYLKFVHLILS